MLLYGASVFQFQAKDFSVYTDNEPRFDVASYLVVYSA